MRELRDQVEPDEIPREGVPDVDDAIEDEVLGGRPRVAIVAVGGAKLVFEIVVLLRHGHHTAHHRRRIMIPGGNSPHNRQQRPAIELRNFFC